MELLYGGATASFLAVIKLRHHLFIVINDWHVAPYLNGEPVAMEGALPLGMMPEADFSVMRFKLAEGDRLVLMLDGIVEATDADGRLFGTAVLSLSNSSSGTNKGPIPNEETGPSTLGIPSR
jgi:hypothetical protein